MEKANGSFEDHLAKLRFPAQPLRPVELNEFFSRHLKIFEGYSALLASRVPAGKPVPVILANDSVLNACACEFDGQPFIAINWGAIVVLQDIFYRMLSVPTVWPHIGNSRGECAPTKLPRIELDAALMPQCVDAPSGFAFGMTVLPNDPVRIHFAEHLALIALDFLFVHEHQHASGGHYSVLRSLGGTSNIHSKPTDVEMLTRQVLELEADAAAARSSLALEREEKRNQWRTPPEIAGYLSSAKSRYHAWFFSLSTLFLLFEASSNRGFFSGNSNPPYYPAPVLMRCWIATIIHSRMTSSYQRPTQSVDAFAVGLLRAHEALAAIFSNRDQLELSLDLFGKDRASTFRAVSDRWLAMHPLLQSEAQKSGGTAVPVDLIHNFRDS